MVDLKFGKKIKKACVIQKHFVYLYRWIKKHNIYKHIKIRTDENFNAKYGTHTTNN